MQTDELAVECTWCDGQKERFLVKPCLECGGRITPPDQIPCKICKGTRGYVGLYHCEACA